MYIIDLGMTKIRTKNNILQKLTKGDKWPIIENFDTMRQMAINADQIITIMAVEDDYRPKSPTDSIVADSLNSLARMFNPTVETLVLKEKVKGADE